MRLAEQPAQIYSTLITRGRTFPQITSWWKNVTCSWNFEKAWEEWDDGDSKLWSVILAGFAGGHLVLISSFLLRKIEHTWDDPYMSMLVQALEERADTNLANFQVHKLQEVIRLIDDDCLRALAALARKAIRSPFALMTLLSEVRRLGEIDSKELATVVYRSIPANTMAGRLSRPLKKTILDDCKIIPLRKTP